MDTIDLIAKGDLFGGLSSDHLQKIAAIGTRKAYAGGINLFHQEEHISTVYVLWEGSVRLSMNVHIWERDMTLNSAVSIIEPGETFGWPALVEPNIATFSAETVGDSQTVEFRAAQLKELMESDHLLGYRLMSSLSNLIAHRLRATQDALQRLRAEDLRHHF